MLMIAAAAAAASITPAVDDAARSARFAGVVLVSKGDRILVEKGYGTVRPDGGPAHSPNSRWRLASITKQATAVMAMRMVDRGTLDLDQPLQSRLGPALTGITARMLLQHRSGLANPSETPAASEDQFPAFYRSSAPNLQYCRSKRGSPNAAFAYNNCDYLLLGELIASDRKAKVPWPGRFGGTTVPGFIKGAAEPPFSLATFGAGGALTGTLRDVFRFDRALMTGRLLSASSLASLWKGDPSQGYQALGQWVFPATLKGCAAPKRVVQRDGEIGGVQTRNYILPDDDMVVIVFTNRSPEDFDFGQLWQGKGFAHDLIAAAACG